MHTLHSKTMKKHYLSQNQELELNGGNRKQVVGGSFSTQLGAKGEGDKGHSDEGKWLSQWQGEANFG